MKLFGNGKSKKTRKKKGLPAADSPFGDNPKAHALEQLSAIKLVSLKRLDPMAYDILLSGGRTHISQYTPESRGNMLGMGFFDEDGKTHPILQAAVDKLRTDPDGRFARLMGRTEDKKPFRTMEPRYNLAQLTSSPAQISPSMRRRLKPRSSRSTSTGVVASYGRTQWRPSGSSHHDHAR